MSSYKTNSPVQGNHSDSSHVSDPLTTTRRSIVPSQGGADRRRVAIVQMETLDETSTQQGLTKSASENGHVSLRHRRGLKSNLDGLALVAPPDAAPRTYSSFDSPSTAPISGQFKHSDSSVLTASPSTHLSDSFIKGHYRSASEIVPSRRKSPRDIGIVGTTALAHPGNKLYTDHQPYSDNKALRPPIFQRPAQSRSPSPSGHSDSSGKSVTGPTATTTTVDHPITPEIGQAKEIHVPVAAPVVVNLKSALTSRRDRPSGHKDSSMSPLPSPKLSVQQHLSKSRLAPVTPSYLHYQPGVHATAGPLPPPPRATLDVGIRSPPPPRPPRLNSPPPPARQRGDIDAVLHTLQLPPSASTAIPSNSPTQPSTPLHDSPKDEQLDTSSDMKPTHQREGAFTVSSAETSPELPVLARVERPPTPPQPHQESQDASVEPKSSPNAETEVSEVTKITVIEPSSRTHSLPLDVQSAHSESWSIISREKTPPLDGRRAASVDYMAHSLSPIRSQEPLSPEHTGNAPSPPSKSFRNSLTTNLKRLSSLPRTPSLSSRSARRQSGGTYVSSRTPSPSPYRHPSPAPHHRIKSMNPAAMYCHEVYSIKNTTERCAIYAAKINDLYMYDCGLADWLHEMHNRGSNANPSRPTTGPGAQSNARARQVSRSSMFSEATFPRRPDASIATDLSVGSHSDTTPPTAPPPLPYPSLAFSQQRANPPRSSSVSSGTPPSSVRSLAPLNGSNKTGFFASLGRKTSVSSKREKSASNTLASSGKVLTKPTPLTHNISRPLNIPSSPSVPGGPRALPNRVLRSQTLMTTASTFASSGSQLDHSDTVINRRPSMFNLSLDPVMDIQPDPEFVRQVDKLVELVPHADRTVLAGYLRRSGQDILAIGQYLEDEKNGTIRTPL